jgi:Tfp pilus assembly protein PilV
MDGPVVRSSPGGGVKCRRPAAPQASERALTLFEVLLATAVLSMVFLGLLAAIGDSFIAGQSAYTATRSRNLAERIMEETAASPFDTLLNLDGATVSQDGFTATIGVVDTTMDLRLIEVVVTRPGAHLGATRLLTYRARR